MEQALETHTLGAQEMVATKEEKRAANAAAQRRRRVRQLFGLPPVGRGSKWAGGLTGWPAVGQQSVDPGIGVHTMNFAWPQGQGQIPVRLPYTSAIVQTQLLYQHHCAGIHIMQQEQLREKTEALQGSRAELVHTEAELQTVREELAVKDAMLATATEAALADASTHREQNETLQARLEHCQSQLAVKEAVLEKTQEKARARKCRLRVARDLLQQQEAEVSHEREDGEKWRRVQKASLKGLPDLASVNDGFDRDLIVEVLRRDLARIKKAQSHQTVQDLLLCYLVSWLRRAVPTYRHFKKLLGVETLPGCAQLQLAPAVLTEFDLKAFEVSSLKRFQRIWGRALHGKMPGTRIVRFGGHGERVAILQCPRLSMAGNDGAGIVAGGQEPCYQQFDTLRSAIEAAGGAARVAFDVPPKQTEEIVGDEAPYVLCPIQQVWPAVTELQLRALLCELQNRDR